MNTTCKPSIIIVLVFSFLLLTICVISALYVIYENNHQEPIICINNETSSPIIGVVSQECTGKLKTLFPSYSSFIAASHVKAVESSGARVVPVFINKNESYYRDILSSINGIVLPGSRTESGPGNLYYDAIAKIYKISNNINDQNHCFKFPIFAINQGLEFLMTIANNGTNFLKNCNIIRENLSIDIRENYEKTQTFSELDNELYELLKHKNITSNWHRYCPFEEDFQNSALSQNWIVTSTSTSQNGTEFIASIEHRNHPFFGVAFQPEVAAYEWDNNSNYPHSEEAIRANRYFFDSLVKHSKANGNSFADSNAEYDALIYNYNTTRSRNISYYEQFYLFK